MSDYGDRFEDSVVRVIFTTHDVTQSLVAPSSAFTAGDFRIYKNGSATEKATANGITVTSPFDGVVGKHLVEIDTSVDTGDSGFWTTGADYRLELATAKTVAGADPSHVELAHWSIQNRVNTLAAIAALHNLSTGDITSLLTTLKSDLATAHGSGSWSTADVSAIATQASVDDLPTNAELATALAGADDATLAAIAALSAGAGSGGNSIAVTVTDSVTTDPIENAVVTLQRTGETAHDTTDVDGETAPAVTSATFQLIVTAAGYVGYSEPLVVTASASVSVDLTPIVVGATDPGQTTGSITVYDLSGAVVSGAVVTLKLISLADGTVGVGITPSVRTATTNGSGIATFDGLPRLARYTLNVDGGATSSSGVTADAPTTNLLSVIGPTA